MFVKDVMRSCNHMEENKHDIDWKKIKEIVCGVEAALEMVCAMLPASPIKVIICGIVAIINTICKQMPA